MKRVVVTGVAGFSPIGNSWEDIQQRLKQMETGICYVEDWNKYEGLNTRLAGVITDFEMPAHFKRKTLRSMGRVAQLAVLSAERALEDAGLRDAEVLTNGETGVSFGSSAGDSVAIGDFGNMLINHSCDGLNANSYIKMMAHTSPVNIGVYFGLKGRVITTSSACTSGSQGIGYAYEAIRYGHQTVMVSGGSEGLCATQAAVFDTLYATSVRNEEPEKTPRPFDRDRDGLVIGEGAVRLFLKSWNMRWPAAHIFMLSWSDLVPTPMAAMLLSLLLPRWKAQCARRYLMPELMRLRLVMSVLMVQQLPAVMLRRALLLRRYLGQKRQSVL